ncbi:MAG: hypothetical protein U1E16_09530 [Hyphomicrobiales bacterium]
MNAHAVPGLICTFGFDGVGRGRRLPEEEIRWPLAEGEWLWLHLNFADWRCRRWPSGAFGLPAELVNEICDAPVRQHGSAWDGMLFGHLADFRREFDAE